MAATAPKYRTSINQQRIDALLESLRAGNKRPQACDDAGLVYGSIATKISKDPDFRALVEEAEIEGRTLNLQKAGHKARFAASKLLDEGFWPTVRWHLDRYPDLVYPRPDAQDTTREVKISVTVT